MDPLIDIRLLGGLAISANGGIIRRFRSQKVAALLAYLALHLGRDCTRERICELLWPEVDPVLAHTRLRVTLSSLRKQLEPPGVAFGAVLDTSVYGAIRLRNETVSTDVARLDEAFRRKDWATAKPLVERGELLPSFYEDWVLEWRYHVETVSEALESVSTDPIATEDSSANAATSLQTFPRHLPTYLTRFFGRTQEQGTLGGLLRDPHVRLVNITGGGGNGKTRLSIEAARAWNRGAVWFVPLSNLWDGGRLADVILRSLDVLPGAHANPLEQIALFFAGQSSPLLVLDNLEQIAARAATVVAALLELAPNLTVLAVSRTRLELPGEEVLELGPLDVPDADETDLVRIAGTPAVTLFVNRSQSVRPDFQLTGHNVAAVVAVCRLLEGIPLAIELAAARSAVLSPDQMRQRLQSHWDSLPAVGTRAGKEDRHRSLRAVIEWSVALLPPDQVHLFLQLSAFRGGATLEAIEAVCEVAFPLDTLSRLRGNSLVQGREQKDEPRFTVLEVLRQWAEEQLPVAEKQALMRRHVRWFTEWSARQADQFHTPAEIQAIGRLSVDDANLSWALEQCIEAGDVVNAYRLLAVLAEHWQWLARLRETAAVSRRVFALPGDVPPEIRFNAIYQMALVFFSLGERETAFQYAREAETIARQTNDPGQQALARGRMAFLLQTTQHVSEAGPAHQSALDYARRSEQPLILSKVLERIGIYVARYQNEYERGHAYLDEAAQIVRDLGAERRLLATLYNKANLLADQERYAEAQTFYNESLLLANRVGDVWMQLYCHITLTGCWLGLHDLIKAYAALSDALPLCKRSGDVNTLAPLLLHLFWILKESEQWKQAPRVLGAAIAACDVVKRPHDPDIPEHIAALRRILGDQVFEKEYSEGIRLSPAESIHTAEKVLQEIFPHLSAHPA